MPPIILDVSETTYEEIFNALEAKGQKPNSEVELTLKKDVALKGPINYRFTTIRRDILEHVVKAYRPIIDNEFELTDAAHFIEFYDAVFNYVLRGDKPAAKEIKQEIKHTKTKPKPTPEQQPAKNEWQ